MSRSGLSTFLSRGWRLATMSALLLAGSSAYALAYSPVAAAQSAAPKAYVGLFKDNSVAVLDTATNQVLSTIPVPTGPHGIVITPDGRWVYVSSDGASTVSVIDTNTDSVSKSIEVGEMPHGLAITPDGGMVLVAGAEHGMPDETLADAELYDPHTGREEWNWRWPFTGMALRTVASPITANGLVFTNCGDGSGVRHLFAVELGGMGDITGKRLAWENAKRRDCPYVPCLLAKGDHLYSVNDYGLAACHIARTGEAVWKEPLSREGFTASAYRSSLPITTTRTRCPSRVAEATRFCPASGVVPVLTPSAPW